MLKKPCVVCFDNWGLIDFVASVIRNDLIHYTVSPCYLFSQLSFPLSISHYWEPIFFVCSLVYIKQKWVSERADKTKQVTSK